MKTIKKINFSKIRDKEKKIEIQGQSCFNDCRVWYGNTTMPKCKLKPTCSTTCFF